MSDLVSLSLVSAQGFADPQSFPARFLPFHRHTVCTMMSKDLGTWRPILLIAALVARPEGTGGEYLPGPLYLKSKRNPTKGCGGRNTNRSARPHRSRSPETDSKLWGLVRGQLGSRKKLKSWRTDQRNSFLAINTKIVHCSTIKIGRSAPMISPTASATL